MSSKTSPTLQTESAIFASGARFVLGVDEVGRGAIAGPVAVGISLLDCNSEKLNNWPEDLRDSKQLSSTARTRLVPQLTNWVSDYSVGYATNAEIDEKGISECLRIAAQRAMASLLQSSNYAPFFSQHGAVFLLDGSHNWLGQASAGLEVRTQVKADAFCVSVAAASVLAKVSRDQLMIELGEKYPEFGLENHKGYASKSHIQAIHRFGPSVIHRHSWLTRILA